MPVYDQRAAPLMEQLKGASDTEGQAIAALNSYLKSGGSDMEVMKQLSEQMEATHSQKMRIYQEMQQYRIDT